MSTLPLAIDKHISLLKKLGMFVQEQRIKVFQDSEVEFATRLNKYCHSDDLFHAHHITEMESGNNKLPLCFWLFTWQLMQVADKVVDASKSDNSLFLASAKRMNLSSDDILIKAPK
jgi:hypothetical protein